MSYWVLRNKNAISKEGKWLLKLFHRGIVKITAYDFWRMHQYAVQRVLTLCAVSKPLGCFGVALRSSPLRLAMVEVILNHWEMDSPQWLCLFNAESVHSGHYGHHLGNHWMLNTSPIEIQIICNACWTVGVNATWQHSIAFWFKNLTILQNIESSRLPKKDLIPTPKHPGGLLTAYSVNTIMIMNRLSVNSVGQSQVSVSLWYGLYIYIFTDQTKQDTHDWLHEVRQGTLAPIY